MASQKCLFVAQKGISTYFNITVFLLKATFQSDASNDKKTFVFLFPEFFAE